MAQLAARLAFALTAAKEKSEKWAVPAQILDFRTGKLDFPTDVDENLSAKICGLLDLQDVEKDHFIWFEDVGNASLDPLLGRLVQREVDSNHADDYGVWVICKDGRLSAREVV